MSITQIRYEHSLWSSETRYIRTSPPCDMARIYTELPPMIGGGNLPLVGVTRFELATSWSRTKRTTKLCHTPYLCIIPQKCCFVNCFIDKNSVKDVIIYVNVTVFSLSVFYLPNLFYVPLHHCMFFLSALQVLQGNLVKIR